MIKESTIENTKLPAGWEIKTLGEVCEINPKKSEVNNFPANHLVSFLPMKDLGIAQNQTNPITVKQLSEVKGSYTYFKNNDVLLAKVTPCFENGKLGIAKNLKNEIGFGSSEYIVFRPKNEILSEYLFYILSSSKFRNRGKELMYGAVGLKRLSKDYVKNFVSPFPPLPQQKQIVATLDKAFAAIDIAKANAEQNLQNAKELRISITNNLFNSVENSDLLIVDEVTDFITDYVANGSFASLKENVSYKKEKDYAMLLRLVDHSKKYQNPFVYVDKHAFDFLKKSTVYQNDIILSNVGARLGTAFRAPDLGIPMTLGPNSILIKAKEFGDYFYCWLQSAYGQKAIKSVVSGAGQPKFNKTQFKKIKVPIPKSKDDRDNIILKINQANNSVDKLYGVYIQKIADLEEMKKSVLQKAFSGQLNIIN